MANAKKSEEPAAELEAEQKSPEQVEAEAASIRNRKYYGNYPRIIGGHCEHCGYNFRSCEHYREIVRNGDPACLCGRTREAGAIRQLQLMYLPHRRAWVCDTLGCQNRYAELYHGYEPKVVLHFNKVNKIYSQGAIQLLPEAL